MDSMFLIGNSDCQKTDGKGQILGKKRLEIGFLGHKLFGTIET